MSTIKLKGSSSGEAEVTVAAAAGTPTFTLPTTVGSANQLVKNSGTAGTLEYSSNLTFDGDLLSLNKRAVVGNGTDAQIPSRVNTSSYTPQLQVTGAWNDPTHGGTLALNGTTDYPNLWINSGATYQDNAGAGVIHFSIKDGAGNYCNTASIQSQIDGTPGNNDSPGELTFWTTPDGTCNPTMKMKVHSNGNVEVNDGNLIVGTSGHGTDFSATAGPTNGSDTQELLDDYEEGDWTPSMSANVAGSVGIYTKVGRVVHIGFTMSVGSNSTSSAMVITGLPFTPLNNSGNLTGAVAVSNFGSSFTFFTDNSSTVINVRNHSNVSIPMSDFSGKWFYGTATYMT